MNQVRKVLRIDDNKISTNITDGNVIQIADNVRDTKDTVKDIIYVRQEAAITDLNT